MVMVDGKLTIDPRHCLCDSAISTTAGLVTCLANPMNANGLCSSQISDLAGGRANIVQDFTDSTTPLGAIMNLRTCEGQSCLHECCAVCP